MTLIGSVLAITFLPSPWRWLVIAALLASDIVQISIWLRWRRRRSATGAEALVGAVGEALNDCRPHGQVKLKGQIWKAYCDEGVERGTKVVVDQVEGLELHVRPVERERAASSAPLR